MAQRRTLAGAVGFACLLVVIAAIGVLGRANTARAEIDISGEWNFEVYGFGSEAVPCFTSIVQTGADLSFETACENVGEGSFVGTIDVKTGEFSASGEIIIVPILLAGTVSPDGEVIEGTWDGSTFGFSGTFTATRAAPPLTPTPLPTLSAQVDLTGTWRVEFIGIFSGTCDAVIEQVGTDLVSVARCPILGTITLNGTIDSVTGAFSLASGSLVELAGVVDTDGDHVTGTWSALGFGGSIGGERVDDIELVDLSGTWEAVFFSSSIDNTEFCTFEIDQKLISATATLDCAESGLDSMDGSVSPFEGWFRFSGTVNKRERSVGGQISEDGSYLIGTELANLINTAGFFRPTRAFIAVANGTLAQGIVAVTCTPEGFLLTTYCSSGPSEAYKLELAIEVLVAPEGGHEGLNAAVTWPEALAFKGAAVSECDTSEINHATGAASLSCMLADHGSRVGNIFSLNLTCEPNTFDNAIALEPATAFKGANQGLDGPVLINASVTCLEPQFGGPAPIVGDVNCSSESNSADAALVLQYDAGLIESLPCAFLADTNEDGSINSVDAALILQADAGLL